MFWTRRMGWLFSNSTWARWRVLKADLAEDTLAVEGLVGDQLLDRRSDVVGLRQDDIFQLGLVGAEGIHGSDTLDRRVELVEEFIGDARGDFSAVAPAEHIFVSDDDAMGLAHCGGDGFPVVRRERTKVEDFRGEAFALQSGGSDFGAMHHGTVGDDAHVGAFLHHTGLAEWN